MIQCFYMICVNHEEGLNPDKIFLQEQKAEKYGKRLASKLEKEGDMSSSVSLYKQEITTSGKLEFVKTLKSFK